MSFKLYPLRNVPDDEAEEMRVLLRSNEIDFHETDAGFFGIGTAAIWVNQAAQLEKAQSLIAQYQHARYEQAHSDYTQRKAVGEQLRFIDNFKQNPVKVTLFTLVALLLILLMTAPFWA